MSTGMSAGEAFAQFSTAMSGGQSYADGSTSISEGSTFAMYSTAMSGATADGEFSTAVSYGHTLGFRSTAMSGGTAAGDFSTAAGYGALASSYASFVVGRNNDTSNSASSTEWIPSDYIFAVGNGTGVATDPANVKNRNAMTIYKNGKVQMTGDVQMTKRQGDILMGEFGNPE